MSSRDNRSFLGSKSQLPHEFINADKQSYVKLSFYTEQYIYIYIIFLYFKLMDNFSAKYTACI